MIILLCNNAYTKAADAGAVADKPAAAANVIALSRYYKKQQRTPSQRELQAAILDKMPDFPQDILNLVAEFTFDIHEYLPQLKEQWGNIINNLSDAQRATYAALTNMVNGTTRHLDNYYCLLTPDLIITLNVLDSANENHMSMLNIVEGLFSCNTQVNYTGPINLLLQWMVPNNMGHFITNLHLWGNAIGEAGAFALVDALRGNTTLTELNLRGNTIGEAGAFALADALRGNKTLTTLHLGDNTIGQAGAFAIANALRGNTTLTTLNLAYNAIGDAGAFALADALRDNKTLTTLHLWRNTIGKAGAFALADALLVNTTLTTLHLGGNTIGDAGAFALADALRDNKTLTTLHLWRNTIGKAGAAAIEACGFVNNGNEYFTRITK